MSGPFTLTSSSFAAGTPIPARHTCDGANVSPPLAWSGPPAGTKSFALIDDDPDAPKAGGFVHWVLFNIPASVHDLKEGVPHGPRPAVPPGALQGTNDFGQVGFDGSCPPPGKPHHYHFTLYALDAPLALDAGARRDEILKATAGHVLGRAALIGLYARPR